jgi:hypothetical protein
VSAIQDDARDALFRLDDAMDPDGGGGVVFAFADENGKPLSKSAALSAKKHMLKERAADRADPSKLLARLVAGIDATSVPTPSRSDLVGLLSDQVGSARYWQHPDGTDHAAATYEVRAALERVARHLAPACDWMDAPLDRGQAWTISGVQQAEPDLTSVAAALVRARTELQDEEQRHQSAEYPEYEPSGEWWSWLGRPPTSTGPTGTDRRPGPLRLYCEEDEFRDSDEDIVARRLAVTGTDRIFEIRTAQDWADFCSEFPLDVTKSYRGNWWMATGRDSLHPDDGTDRGWVIPDLAAAAEHYDGSHLTIATYLEASGTAIPVPPSHGRTNGASVIAGWNPDETVWLSDRTVVETQPWEEDPDSEDMAYRRAD